jgi:hypothetical protein
MNRLRTLSCMTLLSFLTAQPSQHPFDIPTEFIEKHPELIWLKELYLGAKIVSEMKQEEIDKTIILCNQCKTLLYCSHFGGILISQKDRKNLDSLKELMTAGDGTLVAKFMLELCNQSKIECQKCRTFTGWHAS